MPQFRKKPVVIEAVQYKGDISEVLDAFEDMEVEINYFPNANVSSFFIQTLEGKMEASPGDWIVKGIKGEFYPVKPDIFEQTYEQV